MSALDGSLNVLKSVKSVLHIKRIVKKDEIIGRVEYRGHTINLKANNSVYEVVYPSRQINLALSLNPCIVATKKTPTLKKYCSVGAYLGR